MEFFKRARGRAELQVVEHTPRIDYNSNGNPVEQQNQVKGFIWVGEFGFLGFKLIFILHLLLCLIFRNKLGVEKCEEHTC